MIPIQRSQIVESSQRSGGLDTKAWTDACGSEAYGGLDECGQALRHLEASAHTSAVKRLTAIEQESTAAELPLALIAGLRGFGVLRMTQIEYLRLVDYTGRQIRADKRGAIEGPVPAVLRRMGYRRKLDPPGAGGEIRLQPRDRWVECLVESRKDRPALVARHNHGQAVGGVIAERCQVVCWKSCIGIPLPNPDQFLQARQSSASKDAEIGAPGRLHFHDELDDE